MRCACSRRASRPLRGDRARTRDARRRAGRARRYRDPFEIQRDQEGLGFDPIEADVRGVRYPRIARAVDVGIRHGREDTVLETIAQRREPCRLVAHLRHGALCGNPHPDDAWHILRTCPAIAFLLAAAEKRRQAHAALGPQRPDALRPIKFVRRYREQIHAAIQGVGLEGSLPPARVTAVPAAGGSLVVGKVLDSFGHPVAGASARLLRGEGKRWRATGAPVRTDALGDYSVHVRGRRGTYRVAASLRRASPFAPPVAAVSPTIVAGR